MKVNNIFKVIPDGLDHELVESLVESKDICIERIISRGHVSPTSGWYDQPKNEWVIVLKGDAVITFQNGVELRLTAGNYVDIPAHKKHRVSWTDPENETIWLAVHYATDSNSV